MKIIRKGTSITLKRTRGEKPVKSESDLLHRLKKTLIQRGQDVIKKRMWKDGHMVDDNQQYVRSRKVGCRGAFAIYDGEWAIRNAATEFNKSGSVRFILHDMSAKPTQRPPEQRTLLN